MSVQHGSMFRLALATVAVSLVASVLFPLTVFAAGAASVGQKSDPKARTGEASDPKVEEVKKQQRPSGQTPKKTPKRTPRTTPKVTPKQTPDERRAGDEEDVDPKFDMDPDLQKRIDDFFEAKTGKTALDARKKAASDRARKARQDREKRDKKANKSAKQPFTGGEPVTRPPAAGSRKRPKSSRAGAPFSPIRRGKEVPAGPSTALDIPPIDSDVPPQDRTYVFSIKDGTYAQLIEGFARQTGMGVMGVAPKDGKVSFVSTQELTFKEAISRIRMLLFNYKATEPYWLAVHDDYLEVERVTDVTRDLPPDRMFTSIDDLRASGLPDDELVLVIYTPTSGSVADLKQVRDRLPDYVRVAPIVDRNSITIFALVKDIEKYLWLIDFFDGGTKDPRTLVQIEIHHVLPSVALGKLEQLIDLGSGGTTRSRSTSRGRGKATPSVLDVIRQPEVKVIPDDAQRVLLVWAMEDKIEEIRRLLPYIDVDTSMVKLDPVVIEVKNASPEELIVTVQQILAALGKSAVVGRSVKKSTSRKKSGVGIPPMSVSADGAILMAHPNGSAIIVIAETDEALAQVRSLIDRFDVKDMLGPIKIPLQHAEATELTTTLTLVMGGGGIGKAKAASSMGPRLVPHPDNSALWFTGSAQQLAKVRELLAILDVAGARPSIHIIRVRRQLASFVANMLKEFERGAASGSGGRSSASKRSSAATVSKFTPKDEQGLLFVLCTETEWEQYLPVIEQLEGAVPDLPPFVRIEVEHIDPQDAIDSLTALVVVAGRPGAVRYASVEGAILVIGASESRLEDIRALLVEIDRPLEIEQRKFEIRYADPTELKNTIEALVRADSDGKPIRRRPRPDKKVAAVLTVVSGANLTIVEMGKYLIVRAPPEVMTRVAELVAEFDIDQERGELKVFRDFPAGADIEAISTTLASVFGGTASAVRTAKAGKRGAEATGPRFIPQPDAHQLLVIGDGRLFPEIEELLNVLKAEVPVDPVKVVFIDVEHADAAVVVEGISPLLEMKMRELDDPGRRAPGKVLKGRPGKTGISTVRFHLSADPVNRRIVLAAPQPLIDYAKELVARFDTPPDEPIFRTVLLNNAAPEQMIRAVKEMVGAPVRAQMKKPKPGGIGVQMLGKLAIVEAPGGRAVVLHGLPQQVDQATEWIEQLDAMSTRGRSIKTYQILHTDVEKLVDLIMNVVDVPQRAGLKSSRPAKGRGVLHEEDSFATSKTWTGTDMYIQADFITGTMIVAASELKISEIDAIVAQFDTQEQGDLLEVQSMPSRLITLEYADPYDAAFEFQMLLDQMWQPPDEVPQVEETLFGDYIVVKYLDEDRFDEIEEMLRKYIDKPSEEDLELKRKTLTALKGLSAIDTARLLQLSHPDVEFEIIDSTSREDQTYGIKELRPAEKPNGNRCALPLSLYRLADAVLFEAAGQQEAAGDSKEQQRDRNTGEQARRPGRTSDEMLNAVAQAMLDAAPSAPPASADDAIEPDAKIKVYIDNATGALKFVGPGGVIDDLPDWIKDLEKEREGAPELPDIRIVQVRYIDVYQAAEILEEMFNATRQQRQNFQAQQRAAQQRARQQQQQQQRQRQQQQRQQGQQGQQGQQQRGGQRGQQAQAPVAQLPPTAVRIYPNPRDRSLILRADTSQYPIIYKMLATIDQPKPIDSELKVFKLDKLNAAEVEETLKQLLGLDASPRARTTTSSGPGGRRQSSASRSRTPTAGQLPQTILQETVTGTVSLGVDAKDIKLSSNEAANTLVVMAPSAAIKMIGDLIDQLESGDIPDRLTRYYELEHAQADEVAGYLESHFEEGRSGAPATRSKRQGGARGGDLNTPSFVPYTRLNLLTVLATAEQLDEIDGIVERLDVPGEQDDWQTVALEHAGAGTVADVLSQMYSDTGRPSMTRRKGGAPKSTGSAVRFIGDDSSRMLFYTAPQKLRERILATIADLEDEAKSATTLHVLTLKHATATKVAEAIEAAYGRGRGRGRSGGKGAPATSAASFTITPHDPSKHLFVVCGEKIFAEIDSLVQKLDQPAEIGFEFRFYPLEYANARQVHTLLTKLMADYLRRIGKGGREMPAFSVEADDAANALVVLGDAGVFAFIERNLAKIDNPANAGGKVVTLVVPLADVDAAQLAQNINQLWATRSKQPGTPGIKAEANPSLNVLILRGPQDQIDEVKREFLDVFDNEDVVGPFARKRYVLKLRYADATELSGQLTQILQKAGRQQRGGAGGPVFVAEPTSNSIIASLNAKEHEEITTLLEILDSQDATRKQVHVVTLQNADAASVAQTLTEVFIRSAPRKGGAGSAISIASLQGSKTIVVKCKAEDFEEIQAVVAQLDSDEAMLGETVRVVSLLYSDATEISNAMQEYLRPPGGGKRRPGELVGDIRLSILTQSNALVVSGEQAEVGRLETMIRDLDVAGEQGSLPQVIRLTHADVGQIVPVLDEMIKKQPSQRGKVQPVVMGNDATNSLIIRAGPTDMAAFKEIIKQLDTEEAAAGKNTRIVQVDSAVNVTNLALSVEQAVNEGARAQAGTGQGRKARSIIATPDPRTGSIILAGDPGLMDEAEEMIRSLEKMGPPGGKKTTIISLGKVPAEDIERLIAKLKGEDSGSRRSRSGSSRSTGKRGG